MHVCKLLLLHIHEVSFNLFVFCEKSETKYIKIKFCIHFYFHLSFWVTHPLIVLDMMMRIKLGTFRYAESNQNMCRLHQIP